MAYRVQAARGVAWLGMGTRGHALAALIWMLCATAAHAVPLLPSAELTDLTDSVAYWIDESGHAPFAVAVDAPYTPSGGPVFHLGLEYKPVWVRLTLHNAGPARDIVLECVNPRMSHVDLFELQPGQEPRIRLGGQAVPHYAREFSRPSTAFVIRLADGESRTVYLRLHNSGQVRARFLAWDRDAFQARLGQEPIIHALVMGMLLALALLHLLVSMALRERGYLYLGLFALLFTIYYAAVTGYGPMYLWTDSGLLTTRASSLMGLLTVATGLLFSHALLDAPRTIPRHGRAMVILAVLGALGAGFRLFNDGPLPMYLLYLMGSVCPLVSISGAWLVMRQGSRTARNFLFTWSAVLLATVVITAEGLHLVTFPFPADRFFVALFAAAVLLWSLTLTDRVKRREREAREVLEREVKTLSGLLPICSHCKSIRDDQGYWKRIEHYLESHTDADLSHSICPNCVAELYPDFARKQNGGTAPKA